MKKGIYSIAREANVSVTTVSRVLNGRDGVGDETRKKISEIINKTSFVPKISRNEFDNVGLFLGTASISINYIAEFSPYVMNIIAGLTSVLYDNNYNILLTPIFKVPKNRDEFNIYCYKRNICAAVFLNLKLTDNFLPDICEVIPIVSIGTKFDNDKLIYVKSNNKLGAKEAVSYLIGMGHKHIAFILPDYLHQDHIERLEGYKEALQENNIEFDKNNVIEYTKKSDSEMRYVLENLILERDDKVTALFVCDDSEVVRLMSLLDAINVSVPDDVSIVGFDDYEYSEHFLPPLTTVRQPIFDLGRMAAVSLVDTLTGKRKCWSDNILLDTRLVVRKSVKRIN